MSIMKTQIRRPCQVVLTTGLFGCWLPSVLALLATAPVVHSQTAHLGPGLPSFWDIHSNPLPQGAITRFGSTRYRHWAAVWSVAFAPDGKLVASGSNDGFVRIWDAQTGKEKSNVFLTERRTSFADGVWSVAFAPSGKAVAASTRMGVWMCDLAAHARPVLLSKTGSAGRVVFSPNGRYLAWADEPVIVRVYDADTGRRISGVRTGAPRWTKAIALTDTMLAVPDEHNTVRLWDFIKEKEIAHLRGPQGTINSIAFSADGSSLACGSDDDVVLVWEVATRKVLNRLAGHAGDCRAVVFSPDGRTLVSGDREGSIKFFDLATSMVVRRVQGQLSGILELAWSPDGRFLASAGEDEAMRVWDLGTGQELSGGKGHQASVWSVAFSPDGRTVATASRDRSAGCWEVANGQPVRRLWGHGDKVLTIAYSPNGKHVATAGWDETVRLWDVSSGQQLWVQKQPERVFRLSYCCGGQKVAAYAGDGKVHLLNATTGRELITIEVKGGFGGLSSPPNSTELALAVGDRVVVWDLEARKEVRRFGASCSGIQAIAYSPDGRLLAVASWYPAGVSICDAASGKLIKNLRIQAIVRSHPGSVTFVLGGKAVVCGTDEGTIVMWDVASGKLLAELNAGSGSVLSLAPSPNGRLFVSGHANTTALLWDVAAIPRSTPTAEPKPKVDVDAVREALRRSAMYNKLPPGVWLWNSLWLFAPPEKPGKHRKQ